MGLGITGERAGEDRLTLALYSLGPQALGPLLRARLKPITSWHLVWPLLSIPTGPKSGETLTNPQGASLPFTLVSLVSWSGGRHHG